MPSDPVICTATMGPRLKAANSPVVPSAAPTKMIAVARFLRPRAEAAVPTDFISATGPPQQNARGAGPALAMDRNEQAKAETKNRLKPRHEGCMATGVLAAFGTDVP